MLRRDPFWFLLGIIVLTMVSCAVSAPITLTKQFDSISVTPSTATIGINLTQTVVANAVTNKPRTVVIQPTFSWSVSNPAVAKLISTSSSSEVVLKGLASGTITLTATANGKSASIPVKVLNLSNLPGTIVFPSADTNGELQLWSIKPDGSSLTQLTHTGWNYSPRISFDGTKIAFISTRDGCNALYTMNIDGSGKEPIVPCSYSYNPQYPSWSPDNSGIAFYSYTSQAIMSVPANGGVVVPLYTLANTFWLYWGLDNRLFYGGDTQVSTYNPSDSLSQSLGSIGNYATLSDNMLYLLSVNGSIFVSDTNGKNSQAIVQNTGGDVWPAWSPDSQWIVIWGSALYLVRIDGTDLVKIADIELPSNPPYGYNFGWVNPSWQ